MPKRPTAAELSNVASQNAAMAVNQWLSPGYINGGYTNPTSFQSYNMLVKADSYNAVGQMPAPPLPAPFGGPLMPGSNVPLPPLVRAASTLPTMYGGSFIGNPAKTAGILTPSRGILFGAF